MINLQLLNDVTSIKSTDNATPIKLGIFDEEAKPIPLTQYKSVEVKLATYKGMYLFDEPCAVDPETETLEFVMDRGVPSGKYIIEVHLTTQDDKLHIAPNEGKYILNVEKSVGEIGEEITAISVEKLLQDMAETLEKANEALLLATNANDKSTTAIDQSNLAIDIANEAKTEALNAVDTANASNQLANEASTKSDAAINSANLAVDQSVHALDNSTQAVTTANLAKNDAEVAKLTADTALADSTIAKTDAADALTKANQSITDSTTALQQSTDALDKANTAITDSATAESNSVIAKNNAAEALTKANEALVNSESAVTDSSSALEKATNAETLATDASSKSDTAIDTANEALVVANQSIVDSLQAKTDSATALQQSTDALGKANQSVLDSSSAKTDASAALTKANESLEKANTAITDSSLAKTDASLAKTTANEAKTTADESILLATQASTDSTTALVQSNTAILDSSSAKTDSIQAKTDSANALTIAQNVEAKFNELTAGDTNNEVIEARKTYTTLNERLNAQDTFMAQLDEALPVYIDDKILALKTETDARLDSIELAMQTAPSYVINPVKQKFVADGVQSDYVVNVDITDVDIVFVYQNGIKLTTDDYTLADNIITIIPVLDADTEVYVEVLKRELSNGATDGNSTVNNVDLSKYYLKSDVDTLIADLQNQINTLRGV